MLCKGLLLTGLMIYSVLILVDRMVEWQFTLEKIICFHCNHACVERNTSVCGHPVWLFSLLTVCSNWEDKVRNHCDMFFNIYVDKHLQSCETMITAIINNGCKMKKWVRKCHSSYGYITGSVDKREAVMTKLAFFFQ